MEFLSVVLFFLYTWGAGFTLGKFLKESDNFLDRNITRIGIGLCAVPLTGILLSILHIPVDWRVFLAASLAYPAYYLARHHKGVSFSFKLKKSDFSMLIILVVSAISLYMYYGGSLAYSYLEDDDSWSHALGTKYVAVQKTFFNPGGRIHYLDPYPPVYDGLLGIMHQTSQSMVFTLKFFNALVISLSIIFFYLLMRELTGSNPAAVFSTITLAMIPAYLSHFIWAHSFIPGFTFLSFLFLERIKHDKKWIFAAGLAVAAILLTSVTQMIKYAMLFLIYFAVKSLIEKRFFWESIAAAAFGFAVSLLWWVPLAVRYGGIFGLLKTLGLQQSRFNISLDSFLSPYMLIGLAALLAVILAAYHFVKNRLNQNQKSHLGIAAAIAMLICYSVVYSFVYEVGTADRIYDFNDFFIAKKQNMINNPIGIGAVAFILSFAAFFFMLFEQYSIINSNKGNMSGFKFKSLLSVIALSSASLAVSLFSFFSFRFNPGTILKPWALTNEASTYVYSFSFKVWGVYVLICSLLAIAATYIFLIYSQYAQKEKFWVPLATLWFAYVFAGIYGIPTQLFTFRLWMILGFAVSILACYSFVSIAGISKKVGIPPIIVLVAFTVLIFFTSGVQKYAVNTAQWPPGGFWTSGEEISGYVWMNKNLAPNTPVFTFVNNGAVIGMDMFTCHWCDDVKTFQMEGFNMTADETYAWLRSKNYRYIVVDGQTAKKFGINETTSKLQSLFSQGRFRPAYQNQGFVLLQMA